MLEHRHPILPNHVYIMSIQIYRKMYEQLYRIVISWRSSLNASPIILRRNFHDVEFITRLVCAICVYNSFHFFSSVLLCFILFVIMFAICVCGGRPCVCARVCACIYNNVVCLAQCEMDVDGHGFSVAFVCVVCPCVRVMLVLMLFLLYIYCVYAVDFFVRWLSFTPSISI